VGDVVDGSLKAGATSMERKRSAAASTIRRQGGANDARRRCVDARRDRLTGDLRHRLGDVPSELGLDRRPVALGVAGHSAGQRHARVIASEIVEHPLV
jgi:hypothetical protein